MADLAPPLLIPAGNFEELDTNTAAQQVFYAKVVQNIAALRGNVALTPVGAGALWFAATAPTGWLLCDGSAISRTTYAALFNVLGTTYGAGDGATTFNLPDLRQRFPLGKAASGTGAALAGTGGAIDHTHTGGTISGSTGSTSVSISGSTGADGDHNHGGATGSHTHGPGTLAVGSQFWAHVVAAGVSGGAIAVDGNQGATLDGGETASATASISSSGTHTHGVGSLAGASHSHTVGTLASGATGAANPPFLVVNFIVFAGV
jgi:microcystin-dependent protein